MQKPEIALNDKERTRCEVYTRVMGYIRPVTEFNAGKKAEYTERKFYTEEKMRQHPIMQD